MRIRRQHAGLAVISLAVAIGCAKQAAETPRAPSPAVPAPTAAAPNAGRQGGPPGGQQQQTGAMPDSVQAQNDKYIAQITASIAGKENLPAEQVFKDIQLLKGTPAARMLAIMNTGYSKALGTSCAECHDVNDWSSNIKGNKKEARGMIRMVTMINEGNKTIPEYAGDPPTVNCVVCHRGARRPVRNLPGQGPARQPGAQQAPPPRTGD